MYHCQASLAQCTTWPSPVCRPLLGGTHPECRGVPSVTSKAVGYFTHTLCPSFHTQPPELWFLPPWHAASLFIICDYLCCDFSMGLMQPPSPLNRLMRTFFLRKLDSISHLVMGMFFWKSIHHCSVQM